MMNQLVMALKFCIAAFQTSARQRNEIAPVFLEKRRSMCYIVAQMSHNVAH